MLQHPVDRSSLLPPLGRRRSVNIDLPMHMQRKGTSYYYVCEGKWTPLGNDLPRAKRKWAELEDGGRSQSVGDLVQKYLDWLAGKPRAASTLAQYRSYHKALAEAFPVSARALRTSHVQLWADGEQRRSTYVYGCVALLTAAWRKGRAWEDVSVEILVDLDTPQGRDVYMEDGQFRAIYEQAKPWMRVAMDLGYLIGPRPSDLRALRWEQVRDGLLYLRDTKTKKRQAKRVTPELAAVLAEARQRPIVGLFVVANDKGRPVSRGAFSDEWLRARRAAGVEGVQFRDIRAKAATDADAADQDAQALLGHTTRGMTEHYIRRRKTVIAEPNKRRI